MQFELAMDTNKSKTCIPVNVDDFVISEFNTRQTRGKEDIENLAQRMENNGFEITRSPWAYQEDGIYRIFAGGTRLEAIRLCSIQRQKEFHIFLHEGYAPEDYVKLAQLDNENDEYHIEVPFTDFGEYYRKLSLPEEEGGRDWTQKRIAGTCLSNMKLESAIGISTVVWQMTYRDMVTMAHYKVMLMLPMSFMFPLQAMI